MSRDIQPVVDFLAGTDVAEPEHYPGLGWFTTHHTGQNADVLNPAVVDTQELHPAIVDLSVHKHVAMEVPVLLQTHALVPPSGQEYHVQHLFAAYLARMEEHVHHLIPVLVRQDGQVLGA
jgi:hypothetical protein